LIMGLGDAQPVSSGDFMYPPVQASFSPSDAQGDNTLHLGRYILGRQAWWGVWQPTLTSGMSHHTKQEPDPPCRSQQQACMWSGRRGSRCKARSHRQLSFRRPREKRGRFSTVGDNHDNRDSSAHNLSAIDLCETFARRLVVRCRHRERGTGTFLAGKTATAGNRRRYVL